MNKLGPKIAVKKIPPKTHPTVTKSKEINAQGSPKVAQYSHTDVQSKKSGISLKRVLAQNKRFDCRRCQTFVKTQRQQIGYQEIEAFVVELFEAASEAATGPRWKCGLKWTERFTGPGL